MKGFGPDWSQVHHKKSFDSWWWPILAFFSFLYGIGVRLRLAAYGYGVSKGKRLPGFVLSIGNLTAGGTGKTPAVVMLAKWALEQGYRVVVLSRGYGGRHSSGVLEISDGNCIKADPHACGDEPYLLAQKLPGVPVVISKQRYAAGWYAHERHGTDFFILDDGFQHLKLHRDLNVVLLDATSPLGNGHLLPWGPLREPVKQLARADAFILTRAGRQRPEDTALEFLSERYTNTPIFYGDHEPRKVVLPQSMDACDPDVLKGKRVLAFAGIAQPEAFRQTLIQLGADPIYFKGFKDHHFFKRAEIQELIRMKEELGAHFILTTEKDWVRLSSFASLRRSIGYLCIEFVLLSKREAFFQLLKSRISRFSQGR